MHLDFDLAGTGSVENCKLCSIAYSSQHCSIISAAVLAGASKTRSPSKHTAPYHSPPTCSQLQASSALQGDHPLPPTFIIVVYFVSYFVIKYWGLLFLIKSYFCDPANACSLFPNVYNTWYVLYLTSVLLLTKCLKQLWSLLEQT